MKDTIQALGIPHTEVDLILANGVSVDFSYLVRNGDRISVYPVFESIDISPIIRVRPRPLREIRFVLDTHLGRLTGYLRMLGFDALYRNDYDDRALAEISSGEHRILLTRDRGLLKRSLITHGYCVRETRPKLQMAEVVRRFDLRSQIKPFCRCIRCNGLLEKVSKEDILEALPPKTQHYYFDFHRCQSCGNVYWKGSHYERMLRMIGQLFIDTT